MKVRLALETGPESPELHGEGVDAVLCDHSVKTRLESQKWKQEAPGPPAPLPGWLAVGRALPRI